MRKPIGYSTIIGCGFQHIVYPHLPLEFRISLTIMWLMLVPAQLKYIGISVLLLFGMFNFTRTTLDIIQSSKRLENMQKTVSKLESKKKATEKDLKYKKTARFIEEQARNRLNMVKKGEEVLVLPSSLRTPTQISGGMQKPSMQVLGTSDSEEENASRRNFWLWVDLFL